MPSTTSNTIAVQALQGVKVAAVLPYNDLSEVAVDTAQNEIVDQVAKKVEPIVQHLTNNEPWYQSRVTIGVILAVIGSVLGLWGYSFPAEIQSRVLETVVTLAPLIAPLVGGAITLYGRWVATRPIGA